MIGRTISVPLLAKLACVIVTSYVNAELFHSLEDSEIFNNYDGKSTQDVIQGYQDPKALKELIAKYAVEEVRSEGEDNNTDYCHQYYGTDYCRQYYGTDGENKTTPSDSDYTADGEGG